MRLLRSASVALAWLLWSAACVTSPPVVVRDGYLTVPGGDRVYYRLIGEGADTLVFIAGGPALSSRYLEDGFGELATRHGLLFYDRRGIGRSPPANHPDSLTLAQEAGDLEALRRHFGLGRLNLVAHHWGAGVGHEYARLNPGAVKREVLLAPMPIQADVLFPLAKLPNDSAALARHGAARAGLLDSLDPAGYCRQFWSFQFSPIEETDPQVIRRLGPAICDATPARLRAREGLARILTRSLGAWSFADSSMSATPRLIIVGARESLISRAAGWWARPGEGRLLILGRTPLFPWLEAESRVAGAAEAFLSDGRWPDGARVPPSPETP